MVLWFYATELGAISYSQTYSARLMESIPSVFVAGLPVNDSRVVSDCDGVRTGEALEQGRRGVEVKRASGLVQEPSCMNQGQSTRGALST